MWQAIHRARLASVNALVGLPQGDHATVAQILTILNGLTIFVVPAAGLEGCQRTAR
jgi:hypothetical protein